MSRAAVRLSRDFYFLVFGGLLVAVPYLAFNQRLPSPLSPYPIQFFWPIWFFPPFGALTLLLPPLFFWAWCRYLLSYTGGVPRRSLVLLLLLAALSLTYTVRGYPYSTQYQSFTYARLVLAINIATPVALYGLFRLAKRTEKWSLAFAFHWLLVAWASSYAFAYLGETP